MNDLVNKRLNASLFTVDTLLSLTLALAVCTKSLTFKVSLAFKVAFIVALAAPV